MRQFATAKRQGFWDLRAAGNFIGGGTGSGLLLVGSAASLAGLDATLPLLAGAAFVMAGLSLVWLEIGKPWRALNVFFHPQTSWMTREGILAGPLALCTLGFVVTGHSALLFPILVLAGGFLFCQARILKASRGIPAWKQPEIVGFIIATGLAEGTGAFLLLGNSTTLWLVTAAAAGLAREGAWRTYRQGLIRSKAPAGTLDCLASPPRQGPALRATGGTGHDPGGTCRRRVHGDHGRHSGCGLRLGTQGTAGDRGRLHPRPPHHAYARARPRHQPDGRSLIRVTDQEPGGYRSAVPVTAEVGRCCSRSTGRA
ncbi:polysulfide reductase NrfD family protein [Paramagnetospirillum magnetotacticum]|uniref:polysulfide reductase NrfD n=1 Tax=Paramagnetospirillum magnetotacticum TaxID=188 RepID=UPI001269E6C5|nr:polysulfide reductase NrfD [Paramagnetospirillum magnetotacticum]